ncbi:DUF1059 domain-containing protein [Saccharomonospora saliphila]|uniref:DUF1059 domain-containing protein n=1 Tax=Saccharomonospora saliphila TaxID=369829 RepID=UPI0003768E88|nr:DUF1059 domain-containing protein [Saccharomonospora saliphila]
MTRKYVDCRSTPSVAGCTLTMSGEEEELVRAAATHMVDVHGHTDDDTLREGIRHDLADEPVADTEPGAFVQLIEFRTSRIDEVERLTDEWADAIGADRTARWGVLAADRDRAEQYVEIVEFPNAEQARVNSENPETGRFADRLRALCEGEPRFVNLEVRGTTSFAPAAAAAPRQRTATTS